MSSTLRQIQALLKKNSNPEAFAASQKFVPGTDKLYGVRMPVLNELAKQFCKEGFPLVEELWKAGYFEEKILALKIMERMAKNDPDKSLKLIQQFSENIGNWVVCDVMGMAALKKLQLTHKDEIFTLAKKLNRSSDLWQRRLSLVLVEWYTRKKELHAEIRSLVRPLENDKEYYVRKAVVWINKNFAKGK